MRISSTSGLDSPITDLESVSKLRSELFKDRNDNVIEKFYRVRVVQKSCQFCENLEKCEHVENLTK